MSCKILLGRVFAHVTKMSHLILLVHICSAYILSVFKNYNSKKQLSEMKWHGKNCQLIFTAYRSYEVCLVWILEIYARKFGYDVIVSACVVAKTL